MTDGSAVPVDSIDNKEDEWQRRAVAAEAKASELEAKVGTISSALSETHTALSSSKRRHEIEIQLVRAEAIDLEAARHLIESATAQLPVSDIAKSVSELRRQKPFLFRLRRAPMAGMSPSERHDFGGLAEVANQARSTGDRRALMKYLRAKRTS